MKHIFLALELALGAMAFSGIRILRSLSLRAWVWAFGTCYNNGWIDD